MQSGSPVARACRRAFATTVALTLLFAAGCTNSPDPPAAIPARAAPWQQRPVVELSLQVADDLRTATGRQRVVFTPDMKVCELVFRAWPNTPEAVKAGTSLLITDTVLDGRPASGVKVLAAGAPQGAPGTLVDVPLPECLNPGGSVTAEVGFRLTLGEDTDGRVGFQEAPELMAWIGGAFPLLAWVRGEGWARDDAVSIAGETATSEEFRLASLAVTARSDYQVVGTGTAAGQTPGPTAGTTTHRFTAEAIRDIAIAVGRIAISETQVDDVRVHVGTAALEGSRVEPQVWVEQVSQAIRKLTQLFGPFPYPDLWVSIIPSQTEGIEFPSAIQFGDLRERQMRGLVEHEIAHQWVYALVGNNQARDPWIDEAFAMLGQAITAGQEQSFELSGVSSRVSGDLGRPMSYWAANGNYDEGVYVQGAAVLLEARRRVGTERFDRALRAYVQTNAHRIVKPADVATAFKDLPKVTDLLREHGALSGR